MKNFRLMIQLAATVLTNPHAGNFLSGKLYRGELKNFCAPGLNCWSCPAATMSCPIGALQTLSLSAAGFLLLVGLFFGRAVCGFLCPFGLLQEWLNKIPSPKKKLPRRFSAAKYFVLIIFVLMLPAASQFGEPSFCKYICPAGTLEAGLPLIVAHEEYRALPGKLFALKIFVLIGVIVASVVVHRFFCRVLCPLGAIYGLLNKYSFYRLKFAADKCVACGHCKKVCPIELDPTKEFNSAECVRCRRCVEICPTCALTDSPTKKSPTVA